MRAQQGGIRTAPWWRKVVTAQLREPMMGAITIRTHQRWVSTNYLTSSVPKRIPSPQASKEQIPAQHPNHQHPNHQHPNPPKSISHLVITPNRLTDIFRNEFYLKPNGKKMDQSQKLFNNATIKLEWTLVNYDQGPGAQVCTEQSPKYTPLPEVLFLGHTNSGKSSLINNLLVDSKQNKFGGACTEYAYVSSRAGYTKTMNCFNIANKFRLIDSPGYGQFGLATQGEMVIDYIQNRQVLRRAYILIDSVYGFRDEDLQLISHMVDNGIAFEIIFTKVDLIIQKYTKLNHVESKPLHHLQARHENLHAVNMANQQVINHFKTIIDTLGIEQIPSLPRLLFNNAFTNNLLQRRYGYKEIRTTILESCGL